MLQALLVFDPNNNAMQCVLSIEGCKVVAIIKRSRKKNMEIKIDVVNPFQTVADNSRSICFLNIKKYFLTVE